jgi:NAD+ synthase (glutamine-hydrolysing)
MRSFVRVAGAIPRVGVAGISKNQVATLELMREADRQGAQVVVFPELGLSSYTARDLFASRVLLDGVLATLEQLVRESSQLAPLYFVGLPLRAASGVYNVAAALHAG